MNTNRPKKVVPITAQNRFFVCGDLSLKTGNKHNNNPKRISPYQLPAINSGLCEKYVGIRFMIKNCSLSCRLSVGPRT